VLPRISRAALVAPAFALLALAAPVAHAQLVSSTCAFDPPAGPRVTDSQGRVTAALHGNAVFDDVNTHVLRCVVHVDGVEESATPTTTGWVTLVAAGPVSYVAPAGSLVEICVWLDGLDIRCDPLAPGGISRALGAPV
jgi:hypothetical protein